MDMVENKLKDFNSLELYFYNKKSGILDKDLELAGRMYYDSDSNDLEIRWEGEAIEMVKIIAMGVESYINSLYQKRPNKYLVKSNGKIESFEVNKA